MSDETVFERSYFCGSAACVEVARAGNVVWVRGSEDPELQLKFSLEEWIAFMRGVRAGQFGG